MYNARSFYRYLSKSAEALKNPGMLLQKKWFTQTIERKYSAMDATILKWYREENKAKYLSLDSTKN